MRSRCASCKICNYAQNKPDSIIGKGWRWHSKWCPSWKAYQKELAEKEQRNEDSRETHSREP